MSKILYVFILLFSFSSIGQASENVKFGFMGFYQSKSVYRGATTWPEPGMLVGVSVRFYQKFVWRGPSLTYETFNREDNHQLNFRVNFSDDNRPWIRLKSAEKSFRSQRDGALESSVSYRYKFGFKNLFFLGMFAGNEYIAYKSYYYELLAGVPLIPFFKLTVAAGRGSRATNQYIFGPEAVSGWGHYRYTVTAVIPFVPWDGIIINTFTRSKIISGANRHADYIRGESENSVFSTRVIWNL
jgi:hypothetical protein